MTRYGSSYYGASPTTGAVTYYGEQLVVNEFDATPFDVTALGYGTLSITWRKPGGAWDSQVLVRNSTGYPLDVFDGTTVLTQGYVGASEDFLDANLTQGRFYYYALFIFDGRNQLWRRAGVGGALATKDWGYTNRLYRRLPDVFKHSDYNSLDSELLTDEQSFLYKFLSVIGSALDHVRTEAESLRTILDPRTADALMLPQLASQVGLDYEPEIGTRQMRRLIANAIHIYGLKGTLAGLRELASLVTGWPTTVRIGYNIALDDLDAGPDRAPGRWGGSVNATVGYATNKVTDDHPAGEGTLVISYAPEAATPYPNTAIIDLNRAGHDARGVDRMQYAIPVVNNVAYLPSIYVSSTVPGLRARTRLNWLNSSGAQVNADPVVGDWVNVDSTMTTRPMVLTTAPTNARFLEASLELNAPSLPTGEIARACGFMVQENGPIKPWQCAREIILYLQAELINYIGNTSGGDGTAYGWSTGVSSQTAVDGSTYLAFTPLNVDAGVVTLQDAELLQVGDPSPLDVGTATPREAIYTAARRPVVAGDDWTALADVRAPAGTRMVQVGFLKFSAGVYVGADYGPAQAVNAAGYTTLTHTLHVDNSFTYDSIELVLLFPDATGSETYSFRRTALEKVRGEVAFFFDGGQPSATGDYLWESQAYRSPSHFYSHRLPRAVRLRDLVRDFIPNGACFALAFAQTTILDSPRAVAGSDLDPAGFVPPPASGATTHLQWGEKLTVGRSVGVVYNVRLNAVGSNVTVEWAQRMLEQTSIQIVFGDQYFLGTATGNANLSWNDLNPANANANVVWADQARSGSQRQLLWNDAENIAISDGIVTP